MEHIITLTGLCDQEGNYTTEKYYYSKPENQIILITYYLNVYHNYYSDHYNKTILSNDKLEEFLNSKYPGVLELKRKLILSKLID